MNNNSNFVVSNLYHSDNDGDGYVSVHSSPCKLLGLIAENMSGGTRWVQVHDGYAVGETPLISLKTTSGQQITLDLTDMGPLNISVGLNVVGSTTGPRYTATDDNDFWFSIFWI